MRLYIYILLLTFVAIVHLCVWVGVVCSCDMKHCTIELPKFYVIFNEYFNMCILLIQLKGSPLRYVEDYSVHFQMAQNPF